MALVTYVEKDEAAEPLRPIFEGMEKKLGSVPSVFRAMAHSPELLQAFLGLNGALARTKLDPKLRELAYMKASQLNGCEYCLQAHRTFAKKSGLDERQVADLDRSEISDAYDDLQRDVLRYAEQVTRHVDVDESLVARLRETLSDREVVELAMAVGIANFTNRVTQTLRLDLP